jgi:hypothetical protein
MTTKEEIIENAKKQLVEKLTDVMGRHDAERMAGIFFSKSVFALEGKSVAEYIFDKGRD